MRRTLFVTALLGALAFVALASGGSEQNRSSETVASQAKETWRYPIAPGVWYPGDGALREKPVRYYRARCWPGCHHGSPHGLYPEEPLGMTPIYPTSTVPGHLPVTGGSN